MPLGQAALSPEMKASVRQARGAEEAAHLLTAEKQREGGLVQAPLQGQAPGVTCSTTFQQQQHRLGSRPLTRGPLQDARSSHDGSSIPADKRPCFSLVQALATTLFSVSMNLML